MCYNIIIIVYQWLYQHFINIWALGYYYKCTTQNVFCILIFQLLKFWKIKLRIPEPPFFFKKISIWKIYVEH